MAALLWWHIAELGTAPPFSVEMTPETIEDYLYLCELNAPFRTWAAWKEKSKIDQGE